MKTPIEKLLEIITLKEKENAIYLMPIIDKIDIDKLISEEKQLLIHSVVVPKGTLCECGNIKPHRDQSHCQKCIDEAFIL